jgi:tetratricopeptide (TPR) repeat protein
MREHPNAALLARYGRDPESVKQRSAIEQHVNVCESCRLVVELEQDFDAGLSDPDSWWDETHDPRFRELNALADRVPVEDTEAAVLLANFDDAPAARFAWGDLPNDPAYHTGGVVRLLCKRANGMCYRDPRYAHALASAALRIADLLDVDRYPGAALHEWRGQAHKECANALYRLGEFRRTLEALDSAEAEFSRLAHGGVGQVGVLFVRGSVLYARDELNRAEELAQRSADAALHLGERDRFMAARQLQGNVHFEQRDYEGAARIFTSILRYGQEIGSSEWIARESLTLANCDIELRNLREARHLLGKALRRFEQLGYDAEVSRTRWAFARLVFVEGATADAIQRMWAVIAELTGFEMLIDSAIAAVDLAEMLCATKRSPARSEAA